jgi:hypothetical protein
MNREETLVWIEDILDALDKREVIAMIREMVDENQATGEFFETLDAETERYQAEGDTHSSERLIEIARAIASIRQNRKENL